MRAIMVGPLSSTTRSRASTAGLPLLEILLGLGKLPDRVRGVLEGDELATAGQGNGIVERPFPARCFTQGDARASVSYAILKSRVAWQRLIEPTMTVSSPMSAQANGVAATIQMPKAMIPIEIRNENAASMLASIPKKERSA
jgi:hypothetical protein